MARQKRETALNHAAPAPNQLSAAEYAATAGARAVRTAGKEGVRRKVSFASVSFEAEFWNEAWGGKWCEGAKITLKQGKKGGKAIIEWHNDQVATLRISVRRQFLSWVKIKKTLKRLTLRETSLICITQKSLDPTTIENYQIGSIPHSRLSTRSLSRETSTFRSRALESA